MMYGKIDEYQTTKHFLLWGSVVTHISSSKCDKSQAGSECWNIFFSSKWASAGFDESFEANKYRGMTVPPLSPSHFILIKSEFAPHKKD